MLPGNLHFFRLPLLLFNHHPWTLRFIVFLLPWEHYWDLPLSPSTPCLPFIPYLSISHPPLLFYFFLSLFLVTQECAVRIDLRDDSMQFSALHEISICKLLLKSLIWRKSHSFYSDPLPPPPSACGINTEILDRCSVHSYSSLSSCFAFEISPIALSRSPWPPGGTGPRKFCSVLQNLQ